MQPKSGEKTKSKDLTLIPGQAVEDHVNGELDFIGVWICYALSVDASPKLSVSKQRLDNGADLSDFEVSNRYNVDNSGSVFILNIYFLSSRFKMSSIVLYFSFIKGKVIFEDNNKIQHSIDANSTAFGNANLKNLTCIGMRKVPQCPCLYRLLLRNAGPLKAMFFSPKRGDTLDKFLERKLKKKNGLNFSIIRTMTEVWRCHQGFMVG
ncbi:calmodulin-lysine N-methyltransferase [Salix suchowensis]|nr:calmodulin-lysine N-methyltransferase [Salix suchowensis]